MRYSGDGHPSQQGAPLADFLYEVITPNNDVNQHNRKEGEDMYKNPVIINEYAWLWLNRDGSTTTLTDRVYDVCFGKNLGTEERIDIYAKHLGMLSEYWRAHRQCAGVLHFCGLAYSRPEEPRGQTSDHFIDIGNLTYEPKFVQYVKPAFAPVGLMINFWDKNIEGGSDHEFEIYAINDLNEDWQGMLQFSIDDGSRAISSSLHEINIPATGRIILNTGLSIPAQEGDYRIIAEIEVNGQSVKSIRDVIVGGL